MFTTAVALLNKNVDWVHEKHVGVFYLMSLVCIRVCLFMLPVDNHMQWTLLHWFHTIVRRVGRRWRVALCLPGNFHG